jgi:hypothetical protein
LWPSRKKQKKLQKRVEEDREEAEALRGEVEAPEEI